VNDDSSSSRRTFLGQAALAALASVGDAAAHTPGSMPPDRPRELTASHADLGSLHPDVERLAAQRVATEGPYPLSFIRERFRTLDDFRAAAKPRVLQQLNYAPPLVAPDAEVLERVELDDHIRERIAFSTARDMRVPGYLLLPRNLRGPAPAIIDLHSHGGMFLFGKEKVIDFGRNHPAMTVYHEQNYDGRPTATALVRRGYVVVTIDAFYFGERRALFDADLAAGWDRTRYSLDQVRDLNQKCRTKEATLAKSLIFAGTTWPGIVSWDDRRTVDYLVSRPEVDRRRIGCLGISMGGYRTMYLAALDERIRAACLTGFMSTVRPMLRAHVDTHSWVHYVPGLHDYLDWPDLATLAAPRALLVQQCEQDRLFPLSGMRDALARIEAGYTLAGCRDQFAGRFYDVPHRFTRAMQDDAFAWLDRHLRA
jgi:dienelactone hydrolase